MAIDGRTARAMMMKSYRLIHAVDCALADAKRRREARAAAAAANKLVFKVKEDALVTRPRLRRDAMMWQ
jgi:hypothetical protein